ncbi:MAG: hypothetical protein HZB53_04135 [Chloroflexi bacterium]|nr:hypothetical protein [Chloroflexota bacterium]
MITQRSADHAIPATVIATVRSFNAPANANWHGAFYFYGYFYFGGVTADCNAHEDDLA